MQDSFITIIAIFLAAVLLFMFPLMAVSEGQTEQAQTIVQTALQEFTNQAATSGNITLKNYNSMLSQIATTGNTYQIDISVDRIGENLGKKTAWISGNVIGENSKVTLYTEQVVSKLEADGKFDLNRGDTVNVEAKNTSRTMAEGLRAMVWGPTNAGNYDIIAKTSALVSATGGQ